MCLYAKLRRNDNRRGLLPLHGFFREGKGEIPRHAEKADCAAQKEAGAMGKVKKEGGVYVIV
jgi:hypothetical protein